MQPLVPVEVLRKFPLVYLATPYSRYVRGIELAFRDASTLAAFLLRSGVAIFCPIAHTHPLALYGNLNPLDHDLWMQADAPFMEKSDALLIGKLDGWDSSEGIRQEKSYFLYQAKPIFLIDPYTMELERDSCEFRRKKEYSDLHRGSGLLSSSSVGNS